MSGISCLELAFYRTFFAIHDQCCMLSGPQPSPCLKAPVGILLSRTQGTPETWVELDNDDDFATERKAYNLRFGNKNPLLRTYPRFIIVCLKSVSLEPTV